jgi:hypothetical protein
LPFDWSVRAPLSSLVGYLDAKGFAMRRRRLLLGFVAAAGLWLAGAGLLLWPKPPAPGVTMENFRRLRVGMTQPQAEAVLGGPGLELPWPSRRAGTVKAWGRPFEGFAIYLEFGAGGRVTWADAGMPGEPGEPLGDGDGLLDRLRLLLPW